MVTSIIIFIQNVLKLGDTPRITCEEEGNGVPVEEMEKIIELCFGENSGFGFSLPARSFQSQESTSTRQVIWAGEQNSR